MRALLPILVVAFAAPAAAQTVNASGATQLGETLSRYVGKTAFDQGIVKVTADGDAYRIDFDFNWIADLFPPQQAFKYEVEPYWLRVKPLADGTWQVDGRLAPDGWIEISQPPLKQRFQWSVTGGKMSGIYDPELRAVATGTASHKGIKVLTADPTGTGETNYGAGSATATATRAANGGVDFAFAQTMADYSDSRTFHDPDGNTNFPMTLKASSVAMDSSGTGLKSAVLLDLLAFAVANDAPEKVKANQAELKALLSAALPLWDRVRGKYGFADLSVTTPFGIFKTGNAGVSFAMDGIRQDGTLDYGVRMSEVEVASFFLPSWAPPLIPTDIDINVSGANLDLDVPARKMIDAVDLSKDPPVPESVSQEIAAAFLVDPPKIVFGKSAIRNADTEIVAEGEMVFPGGKPVFDMTFEASGYDKAMATLQEAAPSDPRAAEALPALAMVKGMAKTLPDGRLQWAVSVKADGSAFVNGTMVKPADAPAPQ
ncbi:hypothetical protein RB623_26495 [Mesorhizobium sp. LHD-90]|uniref:hypothetical protein n=1 Tax=Mesorhizobium sp. LHD-90 TaxID=3071414 RepID=UPI0027E03544|nr:hypothetical protein [Mesorhizobium sp. LHD-90]MDQ6437618.1 hypothetical protein [Mesorhizobium sp. LHD-90]